MTLHVSKLEKIETVETIESIEMENNNSLEYKMFSDLKHCVNKPITFRMQQSASDYWIFHNYIIARKTFRCDRSITYVTHGDFTYLENLVTLVYRWKVKVFSIQL